MSVLSRGSCPDPEELAAYVDRALPESERRRVTEHLSGCSACYEVFAETVRLLDEEGWGAADETAGGTVRRGPWRRITAFALPLAAALLVALGGWLLVSHLVDPGGLPEGSARELVARLDTAGLDTEELGGRLETHGWPVTRGSGGPDGTGRFLRADRTISFRLGVLSLDLALALERGDRVVAAASIARITRLLEREVDGSQLLVREYSALGDGLDGLAAGRSPVTFAEQAEELESWLEEAVDRASFRFGRWAEAGRLAAAAGDRAFLERMAVPGVEEALDELPVADAMSEPVGRALRSVLDRAEDGVEPGELSELEASFAEIVRRGGGGTPAPPRGPQG